MTFFLAFFGPSQVSFTVLGTYLTRPKKPKGYCLAKVTSLVFFFLFEKISLNPAQIQISFQTRFYASHKTKLGSRGIA